MIQQLNLNPKAKNAADFFFPKATKSHSRKIYLYGQRKRGISFHQGIQSSICYETDHLKNNLK